MDETMMPGDNSLQQCTYASEHIYGTFQAPPKAWSIAKRQLKIGMPESLTEYISCASDRTTWFSCGNFILIFILYIPLSFFPLFLPSSFLSLSPDRRWCSLAQSDSCKAGQVSSGPPCETFCSESMKVQPWKHRLASQEHHPEKSHSTMQWMEQIDKLFKQI